MVIQLIGGKQPFTDSGFGRSLPVGGPWSWCKDTGLFAWPLIEITMSSTPTYDQTPVSCYTTGKTWDVLPCSCAASVANSNDQIKLLNKTNRSNHALWWWHNFSSSLDGATIFSVYQEGSESSLVIVYSKHYEASWKYILLLMKLFRVCARSMDCS